MRILNVPELQISINHDVNPTIALKPGQNFKESFPRFVIPGSILVLFTLRDIPAVPFITPRFYHIQLGNDLGDILMSLRASQSLKVGEWLPGSHNHII